MQCFRAGALADASWPVYAVASTRQRETAASVSLPLFIPPSPFKLILEPIFEEDFQRDRLGPKRTAHDAVKRVAQIFPASLARATDGRQYRVLRAPVGHS